MEEKRRRKASKLHHMARYNDLMTQSDKDFITRIQVSQLVSQDPFNEDFYAQVYAAIVRSRMGLHAQDERVLKFGNVGGVGLGFSQSHKHRRPNAMQRMEQQVERIISNARKREEEKSQHSLHALQGALGKTSGRSYKAAPRQLLQVDSNAASDAHAHISKDDAKESTDAAAEAAKLGREALGIAGESNGVIARKPLSPRDVLIRLEHLYDLVMQAERLNNSRPAEDEEGFTEWQADYDNIRAQLADGIELGVPLEACNPPPFISLLTPTKGKRLLPRLTRHLSTETSLAMVALLVAGFDKLDVVRNAPLLDLPEGTPGQEEVEAQTQGFLMSVMQSLLPIVASLELRLVTGMLSVLVTRTDVPAIARSRPGLALFTLLLSRVEVIREQATSGTIANPPDDDWTSFHTIYAHFVELLLPYLPSLFPSVRRGAGGAETDVMVRTDVIDQPVWQFLAALFILAQGEQTTALLASVRHKVLEEVSVVRKGWVTDEEEAATKINNVNLVLHSLGLDATQISVM
ncbi:topoisomerase II-associated protein PAT1 [Schizophyllum amplum]|uniref:Topoisomerase II-associated protein PAT1 n=1 Tax=Schizophyllum amplum TaxID=97359 RepID=A0A550BXY1_9AGAR|nr:topoisomerase II-associated protein PAT1 [Auriculariopsis ampla]